MTALEAFKPVEQSFQIDSNKDVMWLKRLGIICADCCDNDCFDELDSEIENGCLGILNELLKESIETKNKAVQLHITDILINFSMSDNENHSLKLIGSGIMESFQEILSLPIDYDSNLKFPTIDDTNVSIMTNIVWTMGHVAETSINGRDTMIKFGLFDDLIELHEHCFDVVSNHINMRYNHLLNENLSINDMIPICIAMDKNLPSNMIELFDRFAATISSFIRQIPCVESRMILKGIEMLSELGRTKNNAIMQQVAWGFASLSSNMDLRGNLCILEKMKTCHSIELLINGLKNGSCVCRQGCLRAIGYIIARGNDEQTQYIIDCGVLDMLFPLLYNANENLNNNKNWSIIRECLWMISNIAAGTDIQCDAIMQSGLIPTIIQFIKRGVSYGDNDDTSNESLCEINSNVNRNDKNVKIIKPISILNSKLNILITGFVRMNTNDMLYGKNILLNDISSIIMQHFNENIFEKYCRHRLECLHIFANLTMSKQHQKYLVEECNIIKHMFNLMEKSNWEKREIKECIMSRLFAIYSEYKQMKALEFLKFYQVFISVDGINKLHQIECDEDLSDETRKQAQKMLDDLNNKFATK